MSISTKFLYCYKKVKRKFPNVYYSYEEAMQDFRIACFLNKKSEEEIGFFDIFSQMYKTITGMSHKALVTYYSEEMYDDDGHCIGYKPIFFETPESIAIRNDMLNRIKELTKEDKNMKYLLACNLGYTTPEELSKKLNVKKKTVYDLLTIERNILRKKLKY